MAMARAILCPPAPKAVAVSRYYFLRTSCDMKYAEGSRDTLIIRPSMLVVPSGETAQGKLLALLAQEGRGFEATSLLGYDTGTIEQRHKIDRFVHGTALPQCTGSSLRDVTMGGTDVVLTFTLSRAQGPALA